MRALPLALFAAALLASGTAVAGEVHCDVESDYDFALDERSLILTRDHGTPRAIVMRQGRLFVDDAWVELNDADSRRIAQYERQARATMPLAQGIARDAADIAFTVLGEVAAGFGSDPDEIRADMAQVRAELDARLARSVTATRFDGSDLGEGISEAVGEVVPGLVADIVAGAVWAALTGNEERLQRMENLDSQIEALVEPRAEALERRAQALCTRMAALDGLDNALDYRLPDGSALDLLRVDEHHDEPGDAHADHLADSHSH